MLSHAFVPSQFRFGTIIPIIKDRQGSHSDSGNYRGITISPLPSNLFEHVLKTIFFEHLATSPYQFGFKAKHSTVHALFSLKETINYYVEHGSHVYCSFLDASKAFDRLVHAGLFLKLIERGAPKRFVDIIISWYSSLQYRVRWDGHLGEWFMVSAGVRQGGVLSPDFYSIYVDNLISILQRSGIGYYLSKAFAAAIFYADDMAMLAPSLKGLQQLLKICGDYCKGWDICLNPRKSKNMVFGKKRDMNIQLTLNHADIDWTHEWKYLGVVLRSGTKFGCSVVEKVQSYYRAVNSILRVEGRSQDLVLLRLLEAHCIPVLTYGIEIIHVADEDERRSLRVAYNAIFRRIFGYRTRESVSDLQHELGRLTWEELVKQRVQNFRMKTSMCRQNTLVYAAHILSNRR